MAYTMYLNGVQMPVTPSKLTVKIKGQNKTLNLVNDGEINFLRSPGLTEITVEVLLPMHSIPSDTAGYCRVLPCWIKRSIFMVSSTPAPDRSGWGC